MGLAASQARLLTITSRKSRAQFESMRLSHQKLGLSRNLTDISNEYQNSLDQTKLFYDFYGVNSTDTPLTYNMLMSPSSINDYTPTLISNNKGQIVLSAPYASAAAAAGVPQEGLGCTPSSLMRDAFIQNLAQSGIISSSTAASICAVDYNNSAGIGSDNLINTITTYGDYKTLLEFLSGDHNTGGVDLTCSGIDANISIIMENKSYKQNGNKQFPSTSGNTTEAISNFTLATLLSGEKHIYLGLNHENGDIGLLYKSTNNVIKQLGQALSGIIEGADDAIAYANDQMNQYCWGGDDKFDEVLGTWSGGRPQAFIDHKKGDPLDMHGWEWAIPVWNIGKAIAGLWKKVNNEDVAQDSLDISSRLLTVAHSWGRSGAFHRNPKDQSTLDLSAFTQAWFTYFMQYMMGLGSAESNSMNVAWNAPKNQSHFANVDTIGDFQFTLTQTKVSDNEALVSNFYDTLFNQICVNGWTENNEVATNSSYLKEMLQTGKMYLTSLSDDYYFYQNNYATNTFVKEVSDDAAIAAAESKYTTEKARINAKEQEIDLKMKNLDTEISSLETEYEAVKKVIEGNVSKSFTRYDG